MAKQVIALYIAVVAPWLVVTGIMATVGVKVLDQATRQQCLTHDWPANKAEATSKWCVANGYKI